MITGPIALDGITDSIYGLFPREFQTILGSKNFINRMFFANAY